MPGIDDLKQNSNSPIRVDIGDEATPSRHRVYTDRDRNRTNPRPITRTMGERIDVNLSNLPKEENKEIPGVTVKEDLAKDILTGEDSIFERYKREKQREMNEWVAEKEVEAEVEGQEPTYLDQLEEEDLEDDGSKESYIGMESMYTQHQHEPAPVWNSEPETEEVERSEEEPVSTVEDDDFELDSESNSTPLLDLVEEEQEEEEVVNDQEEILKHLQKLATERLKPIANKINISSFTIAKSPTKNLTNLLSKTKVKSQKWVLPVQETTVRMKEFLGSELETLREYSEDTSNISMLFRKYRTMYEHIASPKPTSYEAWLKSTPFADLDHYFFAIYISSFKGSNYLPLDCKEKGCGETFLTEDIPIMDMVKFENDEAKEKFNKIYQEDNPANSKGIYVSEIVPLSNKVAVGFKDASIYSLFEIQSLDEKFRNKYSSIIEFIPYIDAMYLIEGTTLVPVGYKVYPDNVNKTIKSKIVTFSKVFNTLTVDEFGPIRAYIRSVTRTNTGISYVYPSVNCPKCGKPTTEVPASAEELVFTRYQLGALVNTSLR